MGDGLGPLTPPWRWACPIPAFVLVSSPPQKGLTGQCVSWHDHPAVPRADSVSRVGVGTETGPHQLEIGEEHSSCPGLCLWGRQWGRGGAHQAETGSSLAPQQTELPALSARAAQGQEPRTLIKSPAHAPRADAHVPYAPSGQLPSTLTQAGGHRTDSDERSLTLAPGTWAWGKPAPRLPASAGQA